MHPHHVRRRGPNPFRRPVDYVVAVLILVATVVTGVMLWSRSDIHNTVLELGPAHVTPPQPPNRFPPSLAEFWSRPSPATPVPVVAGPTVVTGNDGAVVGLDPLTGRQRWSYTRDLPLCTVAPAFGKVVAVYHRSNCNEVTELDPTTGQRGAQRNGDAQLGTRLVFDGTYVTTTGATLLDTWRSDMVQTMEYGTVPDFVNPHVQPRVGCHYGSVAAWAGQIGVIERCPGEPGDRLTVYRATAKAADTPSVLFSTDIGGTGTRIVTMNDSYVAVAMPNPDRLVVFNADNGNQLTQYPITTAPGDLRGDPPGRVVPVDVGPSAVYWWTGSSTVALSTTNFAPEWTVPDTLGPGVVFAGQYLVPVRGALQVRDQATGAEVGSIGVNRHGYTGEVTMATLGPVVLEQRGTTLVALH
ncbi:MAG TPA: PQQ-binding-like beta-propeller repeat protein [Pseudonocardiaceae bacterium]|nr:PQQ-binding-like beta-propeller repeat protein [Pseudonocardiaceae bacterium]